MAFVDHAGHTGLPLYSPKRKPLPRQYYTLAALGTSLALWAIMIVAVAGQF